MARRINIPKKATDKQQVAVIDARGNIGGTLPPTAREMAQQNKKRTKGAL